MGRHEGVTYGKTGSCENFGGQIENTKNDGERKSNDGDTRLHKQSDANDGGTYCA